MNIVPFKPRYNGCIISFGFAIPKGERKQCLIPDIVNQKSILCWDGSCVPFDDVEPNTEENEAMSENEKVRRAIYEARNANVFAMPVRDGRNYLSDLRVKYQLSGINITGPDRITAWTDKTVVSA